MIQKFPNHLLPRKYSIPKNKCIRPHRIDKDRLIWLWLPEPLFLGTKSKGKKPKTTNSYRLRIQRANNRGLLLFPQDTSNLWGGITEVLNGDINMSHLLMHCLKTPQIHHSFTSTPTSQPHYLRILNTTPLSTVLVKNTYHKKSLIRSIYLPSTLRMLTSLGYYVTPPHRINYKTK